MGHRSPIRSCSCRCARRWSATRWTPLGHHSFTNVDIAEVSRSGGYSAGEREVRSPASLSTYPIACCGSSVTRAALIIPTFIGVTLLAFAMIRLMPGDPIEMLAGERGINPERHAKLMAEFGFDKPLLVQYAVYVGDVLQGDLGRSISTRKTRPEGIRCALPGDDRARVLRHALRGGARPAGRHPRGDEARHGRPTIWSWAPPSPAIRCRSSGGACC